MRSWTSASLKWVLVALIAFTIWITWRAKALELRSQGTDRASQLIGKVAPGFTGATLDGRAVSLADYRGKPVVLAFWASWCGPCRIELPTLAALYQKTHKADSDYEILAVSIDQTQTDAQEGATSLKIPFPVLLDADGRLAESYAVDSIPTLFVVDKSGKISFAHTGYEMGLDIVLAQQLGINGYNPVFGEKK